MKSLLPLLFMASTFTAMAAEITSIKVPSNLCASGNKVFEVDYALLFSMPPTVYDRVYEIKWEFSQNGTIFLTKKSSNGDYVPIGPFGTGKVTVTSVLPAGEIKVKVIIKYIMVTPMIAVPYEEKESKTFTVGLTVPSSLSGPTNICPGSTGTFTVASVANANSYTWEVPATWTVNGLPGPIVTGQGVSVTIGVPPCAAPALRMGETQSVSACYSPTTSSIKVKGVSTTCGESGYRTKSVSIDYPFQISHYQEPGSEFVSFSVSPSNFPGYQWTFPVGWSPSSTSGPSVQVTHQEISGYATVTVLTHCNHFYSSSHYFQYVPYDPNPNPDPNPDPGCNQPAAVFPNPSSLEAFVEVPCDETLSALSVEENGAFKSAAFRLEGGSSKIDVSTLKPGLHILRARTTSGKEYFIRFMKSK